MCVCVCVCVCVCECVCVSVSVSVSVCLSVCLNARLTKAHEELQVHDILADPNASSSNFLVLGSDGDSSDAQVSAVGCD